MTAQPHAALARQFTRFAEQECRGSSPLYERLALGIAADPRLLAIAARTPPGQPAPNLLLAAVHYLLLGGTRHPLATFYPSCGGSNVEGADPLPAFRAFRLNHAEEIGALLATRLVQTNEVRRSACLFPAFARVARDGGARPLALVEVGASAGLNLLWDRYGYDYGAGQRYGDITSPVQLRCMLHGDTTPPLPAAMPEIRSRVGIDLNPVDVRDADATLWLRALIWPEHTERAAMLVRALTLARQAPPPLLCGDALALLPGVLDSISPDATAVVYHTHTANQFSPDARARFTTVLAEYAEHRSLYRVAIEWSGFWPSLEGRTEDGVYLGVTSFAGGVVTNQLLARCDAHGRWLEWLPPDFPG